MTDAAGIIMPLYPPHYHSGVAFVRSICALAHDMDAVTLAFVLSSQADEVAWTSKLRLALAQPCCRWLRLRVQSVHWEQIQRKRDGHALARPIAEACGTNKYGIQAAKKIYALLYFGFRRTLVLDAEARLLKPLSMAVFFDDSNGFWAAPSYWYTTNPHTSDMAVVLTAAVALTGRLDASWGEHLASGTTSGNDGINSGRGGSGDTGGSSSSSANVFEALGLPPFAYFQDVQHWFYDVEWLEPLAARLEILWGSVAAAVCGPTRPGSAFAKRFGLTLEGEAVDVGGAKGIAKGSAAGDAAGNSSDSRGAWVREALRQWRMYEIVPSLAFAFNRSRAGSLGRGGAAFHNTDEILRASGLGSLSSRPHETFSSGELLLRHYTPELEAPTLALLDAPSRPVWTWRDPSWIWAAQSRPNRSTAMRRLVCRSDRVPFSVCAPLAEPFYCTATREVRMGQPRCESVRSRSR